MHAPLAITLPENTCSHRLCPPHALAPYAVHSTSCGGQYPIAETEEPVSFARAAGNRFARKHMLAHSVPTARAFSLRYPILIVMGYGACPMIKTGHTRLAERQNLSTPRTPLAITLPENTCSHRLCPPHTLSSRTTPLPIVMGVWGLCPHVYHWPLTFRPMAKTGP